MELKLSNLKPFKNSSKKRKRVGRGNASGHGTYSTRGLKGQRSRSGGKKGLKLKGLKANLLMIPKNKGFKSMQQKKHEVKLSILSSNFSDGDIITPKLLFEKKLIKDKKTGVKILANGTINKKLTIQDCHVSQKALELIKSAGGEVIIVKEEEVVSKKNSKKEKKENKK